MLSQTSQTHEKSNRLMVPFFSPDEAVLKVTEVARTYIYTMGKIKLQILLQT